MSLVSAVTMDDLLAVLAEGANDFDAGGERAGFSLLDHGLQCAALLAERHPDDEELQVAGLVHDIGQTLTDNDEAVHGDAAADFVEPLLGFRVAALVRLHVPAKRYLVATDAAYAATLSPASIASLRAQGGPMTAAEMKLWETTPHALDAVELRRCDDAAKVAGAAVPALDHWLPALAAVRRRNA